MTNGERYPAPFHHGIVEATVMPHGEIIAYGDGEMLQILVEHVVHIMKAVLRTLIL